jgi:deazaflavin-dependent oxidoreductase (nitroreductase family)
MTEVKDFNTTLIEEFRGNHGKVGGRFEGAPMVLVHHKGAKTGTERVNPLVYQADGDDIVVFASKAGAPTDPQWFRNLIANPRTTIEVGDEVREVVARVAEGAERERLWARQKELMPGFADYEIKAQGREIPVVILERA